MGGSEERARAYAELGALAEAGAAAACVPALVEHVLCAEEERVGAAETARASLLLGRLLLLDPLVVRRHPHPSSVHHQHT